MAKGKGVRPLAVTEIRLQQIRTVDGLTWRVEAVDEDDLMHSTPHRDLDDALTMVRILGQMADRRKEMRKK